jgi:hypothetical protein
VLTPEHVTVVPLVGAVLLHWAAAGDANAASNSRKIVAPAALPALVPTVVSCHPRVGISERKALAQ